MQTTKIYQPGHHSVSFLGRLEAGLQSESCLKCMESEQRELDKSNI